MIIKRIVKLSVFVEVETTDSVDRVTTAVRRGIYRELDSPPHHIAQPKVVQIHIVDNTIKDMLNE